MDPVFEQPWFLAARKSKANRKAPLKKAPMTDSISRRLLVLALLAAGSHASSAVDITIFDNVTHYRSPAATRGWWGDNSLVPGVQSTDARGVAEDNESEPGTSIGQHWDLEAFQIHGLNLSLIGGFNFLSGQGTYASGDIFIDVDGDAVWGSNLGGGGTSLKSNALFKYDYVIDLQQTVDAQLDSTVSSIGTRYTVYRLDETADQVVSVALANNAEANPWIYHSGGTPIPGHADRLLVSGNYLGGEYVGWAGNNNHYLLQFELSFLGPAVPDGTLFKFTMECGNDNLLGRYHYVTDAGLSLGMLGTAAFLAVTLARKIRRP